jgi:hypothetical protein
MATVNSEILRIISDKNRAITTGTRAMLDILNEVRKQVIDEIGRAALGSWDIYHLGQVKDSVEAQIENFKVKARAEADGLMDDIWGKGQTLVTAPLAEKGIYVGFHISSSVLDTLKDFAFHKIDGLADAAWQQIRGEVTLGILGGKTPQEVAAAIGRNLTDPSIFSSIAARAEVITKTEMGRVFSTATEMRMEEAANHVDGLEKMWRHAGHPKVPRSSHLAADGDHVPVDEPFDIGGVEMMYPRDPGAPIEETINCG